MKSMKSQRADSSQMDLLNLATLGVRLVGVAVIALALIVGGNAAVTQISRGGERHMETRVDGNYTTTTTTVVNRSFEPLSLAPSTAGLALGLVLILASRPVARILILGCR
jgi:hypothetical protein